MHIVGFIIRLYHDARSPECQIPIKFTFHIHGVETVYVYYIIITW